MKSSSPLSPRAFSRNVHGYRRVWGSATSLLFAGLSLVSGCGATMPAGPDGLTDPVASQAQALLAYAQEVKLTVTGGLADDNLGSGVALAADARDRKSTRLNSSHSDRSRMPSSA